MQSPIYSTDAFRRANNSGRICLKPDVLEEIKPWLLTKTAWSMTGRQCSSLVQKKELGIVVGTEELAFGSWEI